MGTSNTPALPARRDGGSPGPLTGGGGGYISPFVWGTAVTSPVLLDGAHLTRAEVLEVARLGRPVELAPTARAAMARSRAVVESALAAGRPIYGVNTGFGRLSDKAIPPEKVLELQRNLIRSHASGVGPLLPADLSRAVMLVRANGLAVGLSGVRPEVVETMVALLNHGTSPVLPQQGSVGASGDLAPLAHMALGLMGEGSWRDARGSVRPAAEVLREAKVTPLALQAKEGLGLVNGTCLMTSYLAFLVSDGEALLESAEIAAAVSFDALKGSLAGLDPRLHQARRLPSQAASAAHLRQLLAGSTLARPASDYQGQDPYVLRCLPPVMAAVRLGLAQAEAVLAGELNAASDNPLVVDGDVLSGSNFHGQPLAYALDSLTLALSYLGAISERRSARLVDADLSRGLPAFLTPEPGLASGYMIPPYLAAALASENQGLTLPASAASLPTSANQEDFNSMGATAGAKALRLVENVWHILAVELLVGCQALELRRPARGGAGSEAALQAVREVCAPLTSDRSPAPDVEAITALLTEGRLVTKVRSAVGGAPPAA